MRSLVESIAAHHFVDGDRVVVAAGTDELVLRLARTRGPVLVGGHTSHTRCLAAAGIPADELPLLDYRIPAAELCLRFERGVGLAFVSNPHDRTGTVLGAESVRRICAAARYNDALVVFDETCAEYALGPDFTSARWWAAHGHNVCVLRSFPEVPVGYLIGDPAVAGRIRGGTADTPARTAAFDALANPAFLARARADNRAARALLCRGLTELGIEFLPSAADFVLARLPGPVPGLRDLADVGLADHVRIPVGRADDVAHLLDSLRERTGATT
ncbi:aminotransferase class I/II-fold pyridoxal phosphate-dependent enzyme [Umezawaea tangerina]|uniref:Histidinol-phosphate aminotransferase n=1 Tax=Umezawaea tangerina TaxID=84725 RepID=A0A2T0THY7_9PSEU|nr:aminotransferase class I/II-fold pyridoxal phosphate-dependent enzyme [Umezawaea tangerina]PRY45221.1 histidinol-phosphate aminotransferase [Umezawaea tangerina]